MTNETVTLSPITRRIELLRQYGTKGYEHMTEKELGRHRRINRGLHRNRILLFAVMAGYALFLVYLTFSTPEGLDGYHYLLVPIFLFSLLVNEDLLAIHLLDHQKALQAAFPAAAQESEMQKLNDELEVLIGNQRRKGKRLLLPLFLLLLAYPIMGFWVDFPSWANVLFLVGATISGILLGRYTRPDGEAVKRNVEAFEQLLTSP